MAMLKGIREKKIRDYKAILDQQRTEGLVSLNHLKMPDVDFYLKKEKKERLKHLRSEEMNYKYKGVNSRRNGFVRNLGNKQRNGNKGQGKANRNEKRQSDGSVVMNFSKREIDAINKGRK